MKLNFLLIIELGIIAAFAYLIYQYPEESILFIFIGCLLIFLIAIVANRQELDS
jgi:hypothetical protein